MRSAPQVAYIVWIMISTVGLLQATASYYGWAGLSFFRARPQLGYLCAAILIPGSCYWFFGLANRNVPGLEGWQLFSRFIIGAAGGVLAVLVLSSLVNASMPDGRPAHRSADDPGLDDLQYGTYLRLLRRAVAQLGRGERQDG